jgi:hypothetical protein
VSTTPSDLTAPESFAASPLRFGPASSSRDCERGRRHTPASDEEQPRNQDSPGTAPHRQSVGALTGRGAFLSHCLRSRNCLNGGARASAQSLAPGTRLRKWSVSSSIPSGPDALPRSRLCSASTTASGVALPGLVRSRRAADQRSGPRTMALARRGVAPADHDADRLALAIPPDRRRPHLVDLALECSCHHLRPPFVLDVRVSPAHGRRSEMPATATSLSRLVRRSVAAT